MQGVDVLTEQTQRFIDDDPTDLVLTRSTKSDDGAGGSVLGSPTDLPAQTVRVVPQNRVIAVERRTVEGETVTPDYKVISMPDGDFQRGDIYTYGGIRFEIVWITPLSYELIIEAVAR